MTKQTFTQKSNGDTLSATEWNNLTSYVNTAVDAINAGGSSSNGDSSAGGSGDSHISFDSSGKHNLTIETTASDQYLDGGETKGGKINIEAVSDIQFKPGDDIIMYSHHRAQNKQDEVSVKVTDGDDIPVKLQMNMSDIVLTTKDKASKGDELNITVNQEPNSRGYLKVRAKAIDLRCEDHGGIALQPKGEDGQNHMNKIKFEHGGGDGLEFGTFNTEKTSIFTDEYRFNREGVWKMATRQTEISDKADVEDATTAYKYVKQDDDFYDIISQDDEQCTTKDIIKTAYAMNGKIGVHTKITNGGALEIGTSDKYVFLSNSMYPEYLGPNYVGSVGENTTTLDKSTDAPTLVINKEYSASELEDIFDSAIIATLNAYDDNEIFKIVWHIIIPTGPNEYTEGGQYDYYFVKHSAPNIKIDSGAELKLGGILDFGSSFNFGETDNGIEFQYKLTKKNEGTTKDCGVVKIVGVNNHASNTLTVPDVVNPSTGLIADVTVAAGQTVDITSCSMLDIINLVNYMKAHNEGPWASQL